MPLEATIMILDDSEFMRNGDYLPTRFDAQSDAVTTVFRSKIDSNAENTVGVMTSAGKGPQVLVTHTKELGQVLSGLHKTEQQISGESDIPTALNIAQLALKHRQNKNLRQRIILFVGSPLSTAADEKTLVRLAKKLKKNNVAVDIVLFGDEEGREANEPLLKAFVDNVVSGDNSHFISIPPGTQIISDAILSSAILREDLPGGMGGADVPMGGATGGSGGFEFDVDPSLDPELAMALRMSLEEERARQAAAASASTAQASSSTLPTIPETTAQSGATTQAAAITQAVPPPAAVEPLVMSPLEDEDDEEAMLARALALSREDNNAPAEDVEMGDEDLTEEEAIAAAIAMSLEQDGNGNQQGDSNKKSNSETGK
ncbi:hypothetical protein Clacol_002045 [Clathrus columnatus]|uniref:VWFA domain-containing protein n=1 Tax=Clathrus columnatus TaxID=1419009 RepID=A0AAV5A7F5_9AGAM|nr:hypothetical protein Clacol_002045 [Clathrus columnatus]